MLDPIASATAKERDGPNFGKCGAADASPDHGRPCTKWGLGGRLPFFIGYPCRARSAWLNTKPNVQAERARGFSFPLFARANDRLSLLRFLAEFAIGSWAIHFTVGAPWQREHRLSPAGGSALIHR